MKQLLCLVFCVVLFCGGAARGAEDRAEARYLEWKELPPPQDVSGFSGVFSGYHNGAWIVASAGGQRERGDNSQRDAIRVFLQDDSGKGRWIDPGVRFDKMMGSGASVSTEKGVVCVGWQEGRGHPTVTVYMLVWDATAEELKIENLPDLPTPRIGASAACIGSVVYLAGGVKDNSLKNIMNPEPSFWALDLAAGEKASWQELLPWPGPGRNATLAIAQHNGRDNCIYIIGGSKSVRSSDALRDVYEFTPAKYDPAAYDPATGSYDGKGRQATPWRQRADAPFGLSGVSGVAVGQSHIFTFGSGNRRGAQNNTKTLAYHAITDTWVSTGDSPTLYSTLAAPGPKGSIFLVAGQGFRSPEVWKVSLTETETRFGATNYIVVGVYLAAMILVGVYFAKRNKNTDDFFRGGQRVPWWAAGLSIFATLLSSITFVAIPSKAFQTDWVFFMANMTIPAVAPIVVFCVLPFFRRIDATSAYEYLEKRFNVAARLFAASSFVLFQIGRMAIVLYLPALALAAITPLTVVQCILLMGALSIVYCAMGGIEAVIWTDTIQSFVLLGGAALSFVLIVLSLDGGFGTFFEIATADQKFHVANFDWDSMSYATTAIWVVVLGGLGQSLVPYASDQAVIQRYMSVPDEKRAARAIWTNAVTVVPASILFFAVGTALYVFYKTHPARLDPTFKNDAIFPLFIARELPVGVAGLVVAGIFAAAQSTVSTSMNSLSTSIVTDFVRRFNMVRSERGYLMLARVLTVVLGVMGTALAVFLADADIKSALDVFMKVLGLFGGSLCGLFMLGIFSKRANGAGALIGAVAGAVGVYAASEWTDLHFLLYATTGITVCFVVGYVASLFTPGDNKRLEGLTIFTQNKTESH